MVTSVSTLDLLIAIYNTVFHLKAVSPVARSD